MSRRGAYAMSGGMDWFWVVHPSQNQKKARGREGKGRKDSYDGDASENIARVDAASTFHFDDADCGVAFAI
jgi:hypothetical protein